MKQISLLLLFLLTILVGYNLYNVYIQKDYKSTYDRLVKSKGVKIQPIKFDKAKIEKLNKKIQSLKKDDEYKLQLSNIRGRGTQPLFIDKYNRIYDKILLQQRLNNNYQ